MHQEESCVLLLPMEVDMAQIFVERKSEPALKIEKMCHLFTVVIDNLYRVEHLVLILQGAASSNDNAVVQEI